LKRFVLKAHFQSTSIVERNTAMEKMEQRAVEGKSIFERRPVAEAEVLHVGIDVHKRTYKVAVWSKTRERLVASWAQNARREILLRHLEPVREQVELIVYEAGPTGFWLAQDLREGGWPVAVVSAGHTPSAPIDRGKSDRLDAAQLSEFSSKNLLRPIYIPGLEELADRQILRTRNNAVRRLRSVKQQIKAFVLFHGLPEPKELRYWSRAGIEALRRLELSEPVRWSLDELLADFEHFQKRVKSGTPALRGLARSSRYLDTVRRLCTVPGVGVITAMTFLLELPHLDRFATGRQLARILGLSPEVRRTGETHKECGRQAGGNKWVRTALVEAAWIWRRRNAYALDLYNRLVHNTGSGKKAIVALARKLGIILWRIATGALPYCPGVLNVPEAVFEGMKRRAAHA
jgi:transposase